MNQPSDPESFANYLSESLEHFEKALYNSGTSASLRALWLQTRLNLVTGVSAFMEEASNVRNQPQQAYPENVDGDKLVKELDWLTQQFSELDDLQRGHSYNKLIGKEDALQLKIHLGKYAIKLTARISQYLENGNLEGFEGLRIANRLLFFEKSCGRFIGLN